MSYTLPNSLLDLAFKLPLSHLGVLKINGSDANEFVQAQFISDCRELSDEQAQLSAWCDPKGRVLHSFYLLQLCDCIYLITPNETIDALEKRLRMYILRAQVAIENVSQTIRINGFKLPPELEDDYHGVTALAQHGAKTVRQGATVMRVSANRHRYLFIDVNSDTNNADDEPYNDLAVEIVDPSCWRTFDILDGIPSLAAEMSARYLPQTLNFDALGGMSFNKGCYPGQEIIARVKFRGEVKKRLRVAVFPADVPPALDTKIVSDENVNVGEIIAVEKLNLETAVATIICQEAIDPSIALLLGAVDGPKVELIEMPYSS